MTSYKIFLTKSGEVAHCLSNSYSNEIGKDGVIGVSTGMVHNDVRIPAIYHDKDYFYCSIEYKNDNPKYELIIA